MNYIHVSKYFTFFAVASMLSAVPLMAEDPVVMAVVDKKNEPKSEKSFFTPNFTYWDTSVNYLDWSSDTEKRSIMTDFVYIELEGGAGWDWGEFYFFTDIENPTHDWDEKPTSDRRFVIKPILDIKLGDTNWYVHVQDYFLDSNGFFVNNLVTGIAYKFSIGDFWIRPFIGPHFQSSTYYDGFNGYMTGWTFVYNFKFADHKFTLSNWHEYEFNRAKEHYQLADGTPTGDGRSHGTNGALAIWWTPIKQITAGVQWRYANYKLGVANNLNAIIYSLKYNF